MELTRREFAGALTGVVGAATLGWDPTPSPGTDPCHLPPSIQALTPKTGGITPITDEERRARIARAQRLMEEQAIHAVVIEPGSSMRYYTAVSWSLSERTFAMVIPASGAPGLGLPRVRGGAGPGADPFRRRHPGLAGGGEPVRPGRRHPEGPRRREREDRVEEQVRFFVMDGLRHAAPAAELVSATPVTAGCRMHKSPAELALMQRATDITILAIKAAFATLKAGMTQYDLSGNATAALTGSAAATPGRSWASARTPPFRTAPCSRSGSSGATSS